MTKKNIWIIVVVLLLILGGAWYAISSGLIPRPGMGSKQLEDTVFEEKHEHDMTEKANQEQNATGEKITTVELLQPEKKIAIHEETVEYFSGVQGFMAHPEDNPNAPGLVIIHEWRGLNDHIKDMARVLAMQGYRVLAVDLYDGKVASTMEEAQGLSSALGKAQTGATQNLLAAETFLRQYADKVAAWGWCLGGKQSLELSLASDTLDATVIYYGRLYDSPEILSKINEPLLGIFAEKDNGIPPSSVQAFENGLKEAGKTDYDITIVPDVGHAFANPTGNSFNKEETLDAWEKTLVFLEENLKE